MTSAPKLIEIRCPACSTLFETWTRDSVNRQFEDWSDAEIEELETALCPRCATVVMLDVLVVEPDGTMVVPLELEAK